MTGLRRISKLPKNCARLAMEQEEFESALEKLWIHGGALVDPDETVRRGHNVACPLQGPERSSTGQIDEISRFADSFSCRMLTLVQHFGDLADHGRPCGLCDFCAPEKVSASVVRKPDGKNRRSYPN